jgi:hypothetical protein
MVARQVTAPRFEPAGEPAVPSLADVTESTQDFIGPDHTQEPAGLPPINGVKPPRASQKNPPRAAGKADSTFRDTLKNLGQNKTRASGVRQLTKDDRDKIEELYIMGAAGLMPFRMKTAQAVASQADSCADAWFELSKKNDSVRRAVLWFVETGVWGGLLAAHAPIAMSLVPEDTPDKFAQWMQTRISHFMPKPREET